jgi:predicted phage terminase large subunit-like protein
MKGWNGLFQCRPSALEGNIFKRSDVQFYHNLPDNLAQKITSWDFTFKKSSTADFVVGQAWGRLGADKYLFPFQFREQEGFRGSKKAMVAMKKRYPEIMSHLVEAKANGEAIIDSLNKTISGIKPINPGESKEARAEAVSDQFESLNIYLPHPSICEGKEIDGKPWILAYIEELMNFPNAKNDDMVDSTTQAISYLSEFDLNSLEDFLAL